MEIDRHIRFTLEGSWGGGEIRKLTIERKREREREGEEKIRMT
jgi:hypothetical protein